MASRGNLLQKLVLIKPLFMMLFAATISSVLLPDADCSETVCGPVRIPFPFGTKPGCSYYDETFLITCNQSFNPPRPFLPESKVPLLDISLEDGELRVDAGLIARSCDDDKHRNPTSTENTFSFFETANSSTSFLLSTRNRFTTVGCDAVGIFGGELRGEPYAIGCVALCKKKEYINNGSCSGSGCCQIDIPQEVTCHYRTFVTHGAFKHTNGVNYFNPCGYAFVVEKDVYEFSVSDLKRLERKTFPVVFDWAIRVGNLTCKQAKASNHHAYACKARNSKCLNSTNGPGYRCKCLEGFQGNPYLLDGCQDIDECKINNPCININATCKNLLGSFHCICLKGLEGDGMRNGTGCHPVNHRSSSSLSSIRIYIALGICSLAILALLLGVSWTYWGLKKRKLIKRREQFFLQNGGLLLQQQIAHLKESTETAAKIFTVDELKRATKNYDESRVLGQGSYGTVYKGVLADNCVVAIKKSMVGNQRQIEQFINEIVVLAQINHRNVVKLLGCCLETKVPLLVYEFITNGTLHDHIHDKLGKHLPLPWDMRLKIATETAGAVAYLHSSAAIPIFHRDIKTVNILLDENYTAKVSDFGASRLVPLDRTQVTTLVQGTLGYLDPEYIHTGQLTEKSDVYSFGVVLAELLTGQKALSVDRLECDISSLAMYFHSYVQEDRVLEIVDKDQITEENVDQLKAVSNIAGSCLRMRGEDRPTMKEIAVELEGIKHMGILHPWEEDDSCSSEEIESSTLYTDVDGDGYTIGSTGTTSTTTGFDSINIKTLNPSDDDARKF